MGTSISQPSARTSNWKRVFVCYERQEIPENRVINEVWRASENEDIPISAQIKSDAVFSCFEAVKSSQSVQEALQKANKSIMENKGNSIIVEFAKRAIPASFQSNDPIQQWTNSFFVEMTNYVISRDASGFVGGQNRNKSVKELIDFKKSISNKVIQIVNAGNKGFNSKSEWNSFVDESILQLKSVH